MSRQPDKRATTLGREERLALLAAAASPQEARSSWNSLMSETPFEAINDNSQRIVPAIFSNLRHHDDIVERERLRGAFKYTWSKNTRVLRELIPVFEDFRVNTIAFRVIKGAAVQAVTERFGARYMGDVDLLILERDTEAVEKIFTASGFRRNSDRPCPEHPESISPSSINFNKGQCHVDVHVAGLKEPKPLLRQMMSQSGIRIRLATTWIEVPPPELLLLHAAFHGSRAAGPTDVMQAALDISLLRPKVDPHTLEDVARETKTLLELVDLDRQLGAIQIPGSGVDVSTGVLALARLDRLKSRLVEITTSVIPIINRMKRRKPGSKTLSQIRRVFPGHAFSYRVWLLSGKFSVTERIAMGLWGGFLDKPKTGVSPDHEISPFSTVDTSVVCSPVSPGALDWRFRIRIPRESQTVWMEFQSPQFDRLDPTVYVNGIPVARFVAGDTSARRIRLRGFGSTPEISIRPSSLACANCFSGLEDLRLVVEVEQTQ